MLLTYDSQLNQTSYYEASVRRVPATASIQGEIFADVIVVGAGFAGLSSAIEFANRGYKVVVLEADRVCSGASGRNGGQAIVGYSSGQQPFEKQLGRDSARIAWDMTLEALNLIDERIASFQIDCDQVKGYLYVADSPKKARSLEADMLALEHNYGFATDFMRGTDVQRHIQSPRYCAAAFERYSGHLHPLKYGLGLAQAARKLGVQIFEYSPVLELERGARLRALTSHGAVTAQFGVLAGNYTLAEYGPKVAPDMATRILPVGSYLIGTAPIDPSVCQRLIPSNAAVSDNNFILDYFRFTTDHRLLFGGRSSYSKQTPAELQIIMSKRMVEVFPALQNVPIDFVWGGFVDISMNRAPDFGRLGNNLYYLQGFSGHGVALAGLAGRVVAQAVAGQAERFDLFAKLQHHKFPGGRRMRTPSLILGMMYYRLRDLL